MARFTRYPMVCLIFLCLFSCKEKGHKCVHVRDPMEETLMLVLRDASYNNLISNGSVDIKDVRVYQNCDAHATRIDTSARHTDHLYVQFYLATRCNPVYIQWNDVDTDTLSFAYESESFGNCTSIGEVAYYHNGQALKKDTLVANSYTLIKQI